MSTQVGAGSFSAVDVVVPQHVLRAIEGETNIALQEGRMLAVARLVIKVVIGAIQALQKGQLKEKLDANPGDGGCQMQALLLRQLYLNPPEEMEAILEAAQQAQKLINIRLSSRKQRADSPMEFCQQTLAPLQVSGGLAYVLQCHLLTVVKVTKKVLPNGIVMTQTCCSRLSMLSKRITKLLPDHRKAMVASPQVDLSNHSLVRMRAEGALVKTLQPEAKEIMTQMLKIVRKTPKVKGHVSKSVGSLFYQMKALICRLKEESALIAVKSIVTDKKHETPCHLLYRPLEPGGDFKPVEDLSTLDAKDPVVVFEAVLPRGTAALVEVVESVGLGTLLLSAAASEAPFEQGSTLEDVQNPDAIAEIERGRKTAALHKLQKEDGVMLLDHVFCNTVGQEKLL